MACSGAYGREDFAFRRRCLTIGIVAPACRCSVFTKRTGVLVVVGQAAADGRELLVLGGRRFSVLVGSPAYGGPVFTQGTRVIEATADVQEPSAFRRSALVSPISPPTDGSPVLAETTDVAPSTADRYQFFAVGDPFLPIQIAIAAEGPADGRSILEESAGVLVAGANGDSRAIADCLVRGMPDTIGCGLVSVPPAKGTPVKTNATGVRSADAQRDKSLTKGSSQGALTPANWRPVL